MEQEMDLVFENAGLKCAAHGLLQILDAKKSPKIAIWAPLHNLSAYIFATKACIDNRKKNVKQQYLLHISLQYGELQPTSGSDRFVSLGHPCQFQRGFTSWQR